MDLNKLCRLCAKNRDILHPIFSPISEIDKMLDICCPLKITEDDDLPTRICPRCYKRLVKAFNFRMQILRADIELKELLRQKQCNGIQIDLNKYCRLCGESPEILIPIVLPNPNMTKMIATCCPIEIKQSDQLSTAVCAACSKIFDDTYYFHENIIESNEKLMKLYTPIVTPIQNTPSRDLSDSNNTHSIFTIPSSIDLLEPISTADSVEGNNNLNDLLIPMMKPESIPDPVAADEGEYTSEEENEDKKSQVSSDWKSSDEENDSDDSDFECEDEPKLKRRKITKVDNNKSMRQCHICGKLLNTQRNLNIHIDHVHSECKYKCDICGKKIKSLRGLEYHKDRHSKEEFPCEECDKVFDSKLGVKKHIKYVHKAGITKNVTCPVCNKTVKGRLDRHMLVHTGATPFTCSHCNKSYKSQNYLNQHVQTHLQENAYYCNQCDRSFSSTYNLNLHQKTIHTNEIAQTDSNTTEVNSETEQETYICEDNFDTNTFLKEHSKKRTLCLNKN